MKPKKEKKRAPFFMHMTLNNTLRLRISVYQAHRPKEAIQISVSVA